MARLERKEWAKGEDGKDFHSASWVLTYERYDFQDLDVASQLIIDNLEQKYCPKKFREMNASNPLFGHCYHCTQALFYFMDKELQIMSADCDGPGERHWWLQDGAKIIDISFLVYNYAQF